MNLAREKIHYVYPGNNPRLYNNTLCPSCDSILIEREVYKTKITGLTAQGTCSHCQRKIKGVFNTSLWKNELMKKRASAVEGEFYPSTKSKILAQIRQIEEETGYSPEPMEIGKIFGAVLPHAGEHSAEVIVPFIQYYLPDHPFNIASICMWDQSHESARLVSKSIQKAVSLTGSDIMVLASCDFSHFLPPGIGVKRDQYVVDEIL